MGAHSTTFSLLQARREEIFRVAERHGARNVRVFGSVARGEDRADSDIDVLVDMDDDRSLLDLAGFLLDFERLVGCRVDVATVPALGVRIRERILREAVPL